MNILQIITISINLGVLISLIVFILKKNLFDERIYIKLLNDKEYEQFQNQIEVLKSRVTDLEITHLIKEK